METTTTAPPDILRQIETIRRSGEVNMFDRRGVQAVANRRGFYALYLFLHDCIEDRANGGKAYATVASEAVGVEIDEDDE